MSEREADDLRAVGSALAGYRQGGQPLGERCRLSRYHHHRAAGSGVGGGGVGADVCAEVEKAG